MVMECVQSASFSALVEGTLTNLFHASRGRQGDPMSPFLFAMVLEFFSQQLIEATKEKKIDVYKIGGIEVESHLAFVDDVVLFCRANEKSFRTIKSIIQEFKDFSGL